MAHPVSIAIQQAILTIINNGDEVSSLAGHKAVELPQATIDRMVEFLNQQGFNVSRTSKKQNAWISQQTFGKFWHASPPDTTLWLVRPVKQSE